MVAIEIFHCHSRFKLETTFGKLKTAFFNPQLQMLGLNIQYFDHLIQTHQEKL
jgi:hypothetical protein